MFLSVFAVAVLLWSEWMTDLSQEKKLPSRTSLLQWFRCRYLCTDLSLLAVYTGTIMFEFAGAFSVREKPWRFDAKHAALAQNLRGSIALAIGVLSAEIKVNWSLHYSAFQVSIGRNPMSASSPPSLPRAFLHSLNPHRPSSPSSWPSPSGPIYMRLSNGSHSVPSPTNSRGSFHGVSFLLQIGLTRETVNLEASDLSLSAVKDLVCSIVDQKVSVSSHSSRKQYFWCDFQKSASWEEFFNLIWI